MKMEDNENKEVAGKGIPWLIESLKGKAKKKTSNLPVEAGGREFRSHPTNDSMGKGKEQHSSVKQEQRQRQRKNSDT